MKNKSSFDLRPQPWGEVHSWPLFRIGESTLPPTVDRCTKGMAFFLTVLHGRKEEVLGHELRKNIKFRFNFKFYVVLFPHSAARNTSGKQFSTYRSPLIVRKLV